MQARLSGILPNGPIDLDYAFTLNRDKMALWKSPNAN
jgi:hypothetical protein